MVIFLLRDKAMIDLAGKQSCIAQGCLPGWSQSYPWRESSAGQGGRWNPVPLCGSPDRIIPR